SPLAAVRGSGSNRTGTGGRNGSPSPRLSLPAMAPSFCRRGAGGGGCGGSGPRRYARSPPERVEQPILGELEHPRVDLQPPRVAVVVGRDGRRLRLEGRCPLASRTVKVGRAGAEPGPLAGAQRGAGRAAPRPRRDVHRQAAHVGDDLRPERALGRTAAEGQLGDRLTSELGDDTEMT